MGCRPSKGDNEAMSKDMFSETCWDYICQAIFTKAAPKRLPTYTLRTHTNRSLSERPALAVLLFIFAFDSFIILVPLFFVKVFQLVGMVYIWFLQHFQTSSLAEAIIDRPFWDIFPAEQAGEQCSPLHSLITHCAAPSICSSLSTVCTPTALSTGSPLRNTIRVGTVLMP